MGFAQLTYRESLARYRSCLRSVGGKLYNVGFRGKVARSTIADANEARDWRMSRISPSPDRCRPAYVTPMIRSAST